VFDDNCVIDAKGDTNKGITIGNGVLVGRNSIIYCKNGDIQIEDGVNISSNCTIVSANRVSIGKGVLICGYTHLLSGGGYDFSNKSVKFSEQSGAVSEGELVIGPDCWLGARVTVLDAACIGEHCVIGACSLVNKPIPPNSLAYGIPAKVVKNI